MKQKYAEKQVTRRGSETFSEKGNGKRTRSWERCTAPGRRQEGVLLLWYYSLSALTTRAGPRRRVPAPFMHHALWVVLEHNRRRLRHSASYARPVPRTGPTSSGLTCPASPGRGGGLPAGWLPCAVLSPPPSARLGSTRAAQPSPGRRSSSLDAAHLYRPGEESSKGGVIKKINKRERERDGQNQKGKDKEGGKEVENDWFVTARDLTCRGTLDSSGPAIKSERVEGG